MKKKIRIKLWSAIVLIAVTLSGMAFEKLLKWIWRLIEKEEPPDNAQRATLSWKKTVLWTTISGLLSSFTKLLVEQSSLRAGKKIHAA